MHDDESEIITHVALANVQLSNFGTIWLGDRELERYDIVFQSLYTGSGAECLYNTLATHNSLCISDRVHPQAISRKNVVNPRQT